MLPFLAFGFLAEIIAASVGFGASTILLPLALLYFDFRTALTLTAIFHLFGTLSRAYFFRAGLNRRVLLLFGLPSVIFGLIGAYFSNSLTQTNLKGLLGLFLISYGIFSLIKKDFRLPGSSTNLLFGGGLSGFLAGLIGTGGALRASFLSALKSKKKEYLATTAVVALAVDFSRISVYLSSGFLSPSYNWWLVPLLVAAVIATYLGKRLALQLPNQLFEKLILLAITGAGLWFVYLVLKSAPNVRLY